ncbi:MAG: YkgJ family cysteine cluster protein [Candidatus Helarchaeota archaeon]|nr:YkgJ family cysteine cluster protein [Candidatus Helarchaeota archaeon]
MPQNDLIRLDEIVNYKLNPTERKKVIHEVFNTFKKDVRNQLRKSLTKIDIEEALTSACEKLTEGDHVFIIKNTGKLCDKCGKCCQLADPVKIRSEEIAALKHHLGNEFKVKDFIRENERTYYFKKIKPCHFLVDNKCSIYDIRPDSCKIFPYIQLEDGQHALCKHESCNFIINFIQIKVFWNFFGHWIEKILTK